MVVNYIILLLLKILDTILSNLKTKFMIIGRDRLSNLTKALSTGVYGYALTLVVTDKSGMSILIMVLGEIIGGELSTIIFKVFERKYIEDKAYEFKVHFPKIEIAQMVKMELEENNLKTYLNEHNKSIKVTTKNKEQSKILKDIIEGKYVCLKSNQLEDYDYVKAPKNNTQKNKINVDNN